VVVDAWVPLSLGAGWQITHTEASNADVVVASMLPGPGVNGPGRSHRKPVWLVG